jgi:DNA-binding beta-propeller fold protein YncE
LGNSVEVIDVMTGRVVSSISIAEPLDVAFNATGTVAYAWSGTPGSVNAINATTHSVIKNMPTGAGADDLLLSLDGRFLTVNTYYDNSISVISTTCLTTISFKSRIRVRTA